jgi:putative ABC transport system permease protein
VIRLPVKVDVLAHLYRARLTVHPVQELLALSGVAAGVALLFAVLVANNSATGSVEQLSRGITGRATLEVAARDPSGMNQRVLHQISVLPTVAEAAPLVERRGVIVGPKGEETVDLIGADPSLVTLGGSLLANFRGVGLRNSLALPARVASEIGARAGNALLVRIGGAVRRVQAGTILGPDQIQALADSPFVVSSLVYAQQLTGMRGRISRVLVAPADSARAFEGDLRRVAGPTLDVRPADTEAHLVEQAAGPDNQLTATFAAISAIVGMMLAFNAMLLTMPERRRFVALLRLQGFTRGGVMAVLAFDALVLGVVASMLGLMVGDLLSRTLFREVPGYLQFAFTIGTQRIVNLQTAALAFGVGIAATLVATGRPILDLYSRRPVDAAFTEDLGSRPPRPFPVRRLLPIAGLALIAITMLVVQLAPGATILAVGALAVAMSLTIPTVLSGVLRAVDALSFRLPRRGGLLGISISELRATATRSIALVATAAIAAFGSVALDGSRRDLLRGLDQNFAGNLHTADLWVAPSGDANTVFSQPFHAPRRLSHPNARLGISAVRIFHADMLDLSDRRVWVNARPPNERTMIAPGELVSGNLASATGELRSHGWAAVSTAIAREKHLRIGQPFSLPTPTGTSMFRLAAIITNLGWPPGAIVMDAADYRRAWRTSEPTGLELDVSPGISPNVTKAAVQRALGPYSALSVQTASERTAAARRIARQALGRLTEITALVLIAAIAAVAAALAAALWQRRTRLAALRSQGFGYAQLWRGLLVEAGLLVAIGSALGAAIGLYGQLLLTRWFRLTTGFPALYSPAGLSALAMLGLIAVMTLLVAAIPGYLAARADPRLSFQE